MLDSLTRLKILQRLSIKPYTYEKLWNETRIHRNRLRKILDDFVNQKMIIRYKFKSTVQFENGTKITEIKSGLIYYILDLNNKKTLMHLRNIELDTFVEDRIIIGKLYSKEIKRIQTKRNIQMIRTLRGNTIVPRIRLSNETSANQIYEEVKIVQNMDHTFSPLVYLSPEERDSFYEETDRYSIFTKMKETDPELYHKYLRIRKEYRGTHRNTLRQYNNLEQKQVDVIRESLDHYKSMGFSRYCLLIILSYSFPTRINYVKIWDIVNKL